MKELDLQKLIVDTVDGAGGFAHKMNNRFLVGVSDLIVKLPGKAQRMGSQQTALGRTTQFKVSNDFPAGFMEVKQRDYTRGLDEFDLDVTHRQATFLRDASRAGMPCGVASFLQSGSGSGLKLWLYIKTWDESWAPGLKFTVRAEYHQPLGKPGAARHNDILTHLYNWQRLWREGR